MIIYFSVNALLKGKGKEWIEKKENGERRRKKKQVDDDENDRST